TRRSGSRRSRALLRPGRRRTRARSGRPAQLLDDSRDPFRPRSSVTSPRNIPILPPVQTPEDPIAPPARAAAPVGRDPYAAPPMLAAGGVITWVSGLVLMLSSFMGWYSGSGDGIVISV